MSMKNSNDNIGNRTRDLPACSAVPQLIVPPRVPYMYIYYTISLQAATLLGLLDPEDAVITNCRNVGTYLPVDIASNPTLLFSSIPQKTSLWLYITWFSLYNRVVTIYTTCFNTKCFISLSVFMCSV